MSGKRIALPLLLLSLATLLHCSSAPTSFEVGGTTGWSVPHGGASYYATWTSAHKFRQGDSLVFNFATGQHDVAKVPKDVYDTCDTGDKIYTLYDTAASVKLNESGEQYYICKTHCLQGQKIAINVGKLASPPSPSASAPGSAASSSSGADSPPPPSSDATSHRAAGLFATLLLIAAALFG